MNDNLKLIAPYLFGSGLISGFMVAILNHLLTRKKYKQEIRNVNLVNEKLVIEIELLKRNLESSTSEITASINYYQSPNTKEQIIYQSIGKEIGFDFEGKSGHTYTKENGKDVESAEKGLGSVSFLNDIVNIERTNKGGRYELWLKNYFIDNKRQNLIPKDILSGINRKIKLSLSAKVSDTEHLLSFVFKGLEKGVILARTEKTIKNTEWSDFVFYFSINPSENCQFRIDDHSTSDATSSIQLKNISLVENNN